MQPYPLFGLGKFDGECGEVGGYSRMPFTRNLYEMDEVVSALQTCLRLRWPSGLYWLHELVLSLEEDVAMKTLKEAWLLYGGGWDPTIAMAVVPAEEMSNEKSNEKNQSKFWITLYLRVAQAIQSAKKINAAILLNQPEQRSVINPSPTVSKNAAIFSKAVSSEMAASEAAAWLSGLEAACRQPMATDPMWFLQSVQPVLSSDSVWRGLSLIASGTVVAKTVADLQTAASSAADPLNPLNQLLHQTAAVLLLWGIQQSHPPISRKNHNNHNDNNNNEKDTDDAPLFSASASMLSVHTPHTFLQEKAWEKRSQQQGRRAGRTKEIPTEALHKGTTRGAMAYRYTNVDELRWPVPYLTESTRFWRQAMTAAGVHEDPDTGGIVFPDDATYERMYDQLFPDDMPDEWSAADQRISHGRGCLETAPDPPAMPPVRDEPLPMDVWLSGLSICA